MFSLKTFVFFVYCNNYFFFNDFAWLSVRISDVLGNVEVMQLDFEMENFTSLSVTRRINWNIDYKGQGPSADSEKVVTELTVVQRDIQAILPLAMVSAATGGGRVRRGGGEEGCWIYPDFMNLRSIVCVWFVCLFLLRGF